jgi:hypothetical protein
MNLAQYYEYIGTLPRNNEVFFNPDEHKDDLVEEAEKQIADGYNAEDGKNYYNGIESDDREEERMINADRANARGDDGLYDNIISGSYDTNIDVGGGNP